MRHIVPLFITLGLFISCTQTTASKLNVVSTIKPVHSIVVALAGDLVNHSQIVPDFSSPHDYSFRPSDIRKIKHADIIFQIDENMEAILQPALALKAKETPLVSLVDEAEIKLLPMIQKGSKDSANIENNEEKKHQGHHHGNVNYHVWTSAKNTLLMAQAIKKALAKKDPKHAGQYQENLEQFTRSLQSTDQQISQQLKGLDNKPYIVFHNSWPYFAKDYNLQEPRAISLHEGVSLDVKTLINIRKTIKMDKVGCVFSGSEVNPKQLAVLIENLPVKTSEIDVLQRHYPLTKKTTTDWFKGIAQKVKTCLE